MYSEIVKAVMETAAEGFRREGEEISVHRGERPETLEGPAVLVNIAEAQESPGMGGRSRRDTQVEIFYIPPAKEDSEHDRYWAADLLMELTEIITLPGGEQLRGTKKSFQNQEGGLRFTVNYNAFILRAKEKEPDMEDMQFKERTGE